LILPYQITDVYGLQGLASPSGSLLSANAELVNNINAAGTSTWNSSAGFVPIGNGTTFFTGTFNGQDFTVDGLTIHTPGGSNVGLFGAIGSGAMIENVGVTNVQISGNQSVGGLVGANQGNGTITGAYSTGTVSGSSFVGGLVGYNFQGTTSNDYSTATVSGNGNVGGLVGENDAGGTIDNAFSTGTVSGSANTGGLVGTNLGAISNAYSRGAVSGSTDVGGLVGFNNSTISNSFWDTDTAGSTVVSGVGSDTTPNTTAGVIGTTTANLEMQTYILTNAPTVPTWDFVNTWTTYGDTNTPQLIGLPAVPLPVLVIVDMGTGPGDPTSPTAPVTTTITQIGPISQPGQSPVQGNPGNTVTQNTDIVGGADGVASAQDQPSDQDHRRKLANAFGNGKADDLIKIIREDIKDGSTVNTGTESAKWASNTGLSKIVHVGEYAQVFQGLATPFVGDPLIFKLFQQQATASVRNELSQAAWGTKGNGH
jgi:hypothetical protein